MKTLIATLFFIPNIIKNFLWKAGEKVIGQDFRTYSLFNAPYSVWIYFYLTWGHRQKWDYRLFKGLFALKNLGFHN